MAACLNSDLGAFRYLVHVSGICTGYPLLYAIAAVVPRSSNLSMAQAFFLLDQLVEDLTDPKLALCNKNKEAALEAKANGNACISDGDFPNALRFYSQALHIAPTDVDDGEKI